MRQIFIILFGLLSISASAQETQSEAISVEGSVLGEGIPLPYAHVYIPNTSMGTVTNSNGEFLLRIQKEFSDKDIKVIVSCIGFVSAELPPIAFSGKGIVVNLIPATIELPEIIIMGGVDSSQLILYKAIDKIRQNFPRKRHLIEAFYRELSIKDTTYTRLIESAILVDEPGYKVNTVNSDDLSLEKNRIQIIELRKSEDNRGYDLLGWAYEKIFGEKNDIFEILHDNYVRYIGKSSNHFLSKDFLKEYETDIVEVTSYEENPVVVISLNSRDKDLFFTRSITIYINKTDYGILRIDNNLIVNPSRKEILKFAIDNKYFYQSVITYQKNQGFYVPHYIRTRKYASNTNPLNNNSLQYSDIEFLVNGFYYKEYDRVKSKYMLKKNQDINKTNMKYNEQFWQNYNTVILNPISGKTKRDMEKVTSLEDQFRRN